MHEALLNQLNKLKKSVNNSDFINVAYDLTDQLEQNDNAFEAVEPLLRIIEKNPYTDFGSPGPLVHFVEKFYRNGYEEKLIESLKRHPTSLTVWMLNRIINGSKGYLKTCYIKQMEEILFFPGLEERIKTEVLNFLALHK